MTHSTKGLLNYMANKRRYAGVIKPTVPEPRVFFGSIQEIADHCKIVYRTAWDLVTLEGYVTSTGYRRMTPEEEEQYYTPPKPPVLKPRKTKYSVKGKWRIVFHKNWVRGYAIPKNKEDRFIGSPQEFVRFVGCNIGQVYRLLNTHQKLPEKYPLRSVKGWSIYRVYKNTPKNTLTDK